MASENVERLRRRAAEIRARQADAEVAGIAGEVRDQLAAHAAKLAGIDDLMRATVAAAGLTPDEPARPRLRLISGGGS
jgi:hypothetical protein